ncbi:HDR010Cp [Eremothecium sinecaudum]|uniref:HDR010Cp n=1 Tax=Eremothecium sinecaudum TaxID=45286 RepID=A0A0X8HST6_9SACH|nr:HDR010Cp [Eremothecium sinecaudum]AMD20753.1 HDR010Cp [Eremothecium sinecaudum]
MLKRFSHSRGSSVGENTGGHSIFHKRTPSNNNPPNTGSPAPSNTVVSGSRSSVNSSASNFLAEQYERDRKSIIQSCFQKVDPVTNTAANVYITHVRIIENSKYPSSRPPIDSPLSNKKKRILIVSARANGMGKLLHKARENSNGTIQIGRSWDMNELTLIERDTERNEGFFFLMGKRYYWETNSAKERTVFVKSVVKIYMENSNGRLPQLINWDLSLFDLDERVYQRAVISSFKQTSDNSRNKPTQFNPQLMYDHRSPSRNENSQSEQNSAVKKPTGNAVQTYKKEKRIISGDAKGPMSIPEHSYEQSQTYEPPARQKNTVQAQAKYKKEYHAYSQNSITPVTPVTPAMGLSDSAHVNFSPLTTNTYTSGTDDTKYNNIIHENDTRKPKKQNGSEPQALASNSRNNKSELPSQLYRNDDKKKSPAHAISQELVTDEGSEIHNFVRTVATIRDGNPNSGDSFTFTKPSTPADSTLDFSRADVPHFASTTDLPHPLQIHHEQLENDEVAYTQVRNSRALNDFSDSHQKPTLNASDINQSSHELQRSPEETEELNYQAVVDILDEINWSAHDNSTYILDRLMKKVAEAEYQLNEQLMTLPKSVSDLNAYKSKTIDECQKMDPTLSFFTMELTSVSRDIDYVEKQSNGLQVEAANKKMLWKELSEMLDSVSLAGFSLEELLTLPLTKSNLGKLESLLCALHKAIGALDSGSKREQYGLGEIRALKDRRQAYKRITDQFLKRVLQQLDVKFKNLTVSSTGLADSLTELLVFSSLPLFCKDVSEDIYDELMAQFTSAILPAYESRIADINEFVKVNAIKPLAPPDKEVKNELISLWESFRKTKKLNFTKCSKEDELNTFLKAFGAMEELCISYQNFIDRFFHISSNLSFPEYVNKYDQNSRQFDLYEVLELQSNRDSAKSKYQMVNSVFQSHFNKFVIEVSQNLKKNTCHIPAALFYLENKAKLLKPTDQEFLLTMLLKAFEKMKQDWESYVNERIMHNERSNIDFNSKTLFPDILSFPIFVRVAEEEVDFMSSKVDVTVEDNEGVSKYLDITYCNWGNSLTKILTEGEQPDTNNTLLPANISLKLEKSIAFIRNSHWLVETLPILRKESLASIVHKSKQVFDTQKEIYADILLHQEMGDLFAFVEGAHGLIKTSSPNANPSSWAAYSPHHLSTLINKYTSQKIDEIVGNLYGVMVLHFSVDNKMAENLCEKLWSCVQGETVSFYLRFYSLVDKHYKGTYINFTKNDIIGSFDKHKDFNAK